MLAWLQRYRDHDVIKLITGVRGCGKSTLLNAYRSRLLAEGVAEKRIIMLNLEAPQHRNIRAPEDLLDYITSKAPANQRFYLLLDEIHELHGFDIALGSLFALKHFDIVATCSNKSPVSNHFNAYLSGRFVHVEMTTPPFCEIPARRNGTFERRLEDYRHFGALPYMFRLRDDPQAAGNYLTGLWNTILVKDILSRNRIADSQLIERLLERIYEHTGEIESLRKLGAHATVDGREAAPNTIETYLQAIDESMLVRRVLKFDAFTGEAVKSGYCFYWADLALGHNRYGDFPGAQTNIARNLIYLELCARGGTVRCGRYDKADFDFVVVDKNDFHCWQYAPELMGDRLPTCITSPFRRIPRNIPKTVITRHHLPQRLPVGVEAITLEQFLMRKA